ncbi:MAG: sulfate reduction electron transfer complex DsrMKJOP subunit DsrM [Deltaproteobacteria bacterium]|nr:sulfate reduction electron transfer complex DsrMKJOP subunit DsrM [Deltaproteobacteria bacterium]
MNVVLPFFAVLALILAGYVGVKVLDLKFLFGVLLPYAAIAVFIGGFVYRIVRWAKSPVPFRIPTTCGQQKSLDWIESDRLDNPHDTKGVIARMALEILFFRSLFRNTKTEIKDGPKVVYGPNLWLWAAALAFHYSFLTIFVRHLRFFTEPVPMLVGLLNEADGFFQVGVPPVMVTSLVILGALGFLLLRRLFTPQIRYISLAADYFPLFLIIGIAGTGVLLRHFVRTDIVGVKELAMGLVSFKPAIPQGVHWLFYVHLLLVTTLIAYFPWSKLMHMGGVFLSPTRNLANNNRMVRHVNPWNGPVKVHTYEEYEDDFREKMKAAGLPVDKE